MTVLELITKLGAQGIKLWLDGEQLRFKAPKGALTPELREQLVANKAAVIGFLKQTQVTDEQQPIELIDRSSKLPLSFAQQRLWFLDQLDPGNPAYNMPAALRLSGQLDVEILQRVFQELVRRHESLRTTFRVSDDEVHQVILDAGEWWLAVNYDLSALSESELQVRMQELMLDEATRTFDLTEGTHSPYRRIRLLRTRLARLTPVEAEQQEYILFITLHHIVSDGWSMGVLLREVTQLYDAFSQGQPSPLPDLTFQYPDFAHWQQQWLQGKVLEQKLDYWRGQLADVPLLNLPLDRPRPPVLTHNGAFVEYHLDAELASGLSQLALQTSTTLFMVGLAVFKVLMQRYAGQDDICVGSPIANRNRAELEPLIGFFVNSLALRTDLSGNPTFDDLLKRVQDVTLGAYAHQDLPFERLVEDLGVDRDRSYTPLFQVLFVMQNNPGNLSVQLPELAVESIVVETHTAKFDLTMTLTETENGILGALEYNTDLFDRATIERMIGHFRTLLRAVVDNPQQPLAQLPLLAADELQQQLQTWAPSAESLASGQSLVEIFERQVAERGSAEALICGDQVWSYQQLNERANQVAHALLAVGVQTNERVAISLERSCDLISGIVGILKAGAAYVPVDPTSPADRTQFIVQDAGVQRLVSQRSVLAHIPCDDLTAILVDELDSSLSVANPPLRSNGDSLAYVIYTSGTTGRPKGVLLPHRNVERLFSATDQWFDFSADDTWTMFHSFAFDFSVWEIWGALLFGGRLVVVAADVAKSSDDFYQLLLDQQVTILNQTPSAFAQLIAHDEERHQQGKGAELSLRKVVFGGEALDFTNLQPWVDRHGYDSPELINMYGITETTVHVTYHRIDADDFAQRASIIGRPMRDLSLYILDPNRNLMPVGSVGELYIGGAGLADGYLNREDLTAERFAEISLSGQAPERLYKTGDLGRFLSDGRVEYMGRCDDQVKIRGFRIELGEIESVIRQYPGVKDTVVLAREDQPGDKRLVAYVVGDGLRGVVGLREYLKKQVPEYMIPAAFLVLEALPLTANGKIDKRALPKPDQAAQVTTPFVAPRNPVEIQMAAIWSEVLGIDRIGINDNFFELGGHSLLATQLVSRIRNAFEVELPLREFFEAPTVAGLVATVQNARTHLSRLAPEIVPVDRAQPLPMSFSQQRLWIIDQFEPGNPAYNIPFALRLTGELDSAAMSRAFAELVARHESLRTVFSNDGGVMTQVIEAPQAYQLPLDDLTGLPSTQRQRRADELVMEDANQSFDLSTGPLFRAKLLKLAEQEHILVAAIHHIVSDGWSIGVIEKELGALYAAYRDGVTPTLPELPIQYADFSHWQQEWLQGDVLQQHLDYWVDKLTGAPDVLRLPTDYKRPEMQTFNGALKNFTVDADLLTSIRHFSQQQGVTLFTTLVAAYSVFLARYSGQEDVCIGTPVAGRNRTEIEPIIGFFINAVALRNDVSGNPSVEQLMQRIHDTVMGAFAHQEIPIEKVLDALQLERSLSHGPLVQVGFSYQTEDSEPGKLMFAGLDVDEVASEQISAKYDFTLVMAESPDGLRGAVEYNTDLFKEETIERMVGHYLHMLGEMVSDARQPINGISCVRESELYPLLEANADNFQRLLPLTGVQRDLYLNAMIDPDTHSNCVGYMIDLRCDLNIEAWRQALQHLSDTQEVLRTQILPTHAPYIDVAYQAVAKPQPIHLSIEDLSEQNWDEQASVDALVDRHIYRPYRVGKEPLVQYQLFKLSDQRHIMVFSGNHILLDGIALGMHGTLLLTNYEKALAAEPLVSQEDPFADHVQSERRLMDTYELRQFWGDKLRPVEPLDFAMPGQSSDNDAIVERGELVVQELVFDDEHYSAIKRFCRKQRITPAIYVKCLYGLLIQTYCRAESDFNVSEFSAGRDKGHHTALGCYYQQFPFVFPKTLLSGDSELSELFTYARQYQRDIKGKQHISIMEQRRLAPHGRLGFMYNFYHFYPSYVLDGEPVITREYAPHVDNYVRLIARDFQQKMQLNLHFHNHQFDDLDFLERMESLSQQILAGVSNVKALDFVTANERQQQVAHWNQTQVEIPDYHCLQAWLEDQVAKTPDNIALISGDIEWTYRQLNERANQAAHFLRSQGVGPNIRVGICMGRSPEMMVAVLAVLKSGGAYIPMDANYPRERLAYMLEDAGAPVLLTQSCLLQQLPKHAGRTVCLDVAGPDWDDIAQHSQTNPEHHNEPDHLIYIIYTSGSTGRPKGAAVTHRGEVNLQNWYTREFSMRASDRSLIISAFGFDLTQKNLFASLLVGAAMIVPEMEHYDPREVEQLIEHHQVSFLNCAPSAFYPLVEDTKDYSALDSLRTLVLGGEPLRLERLATWVLHSEFDCEIVNNYGPTECTDIAAFHRIEDPLAQINKAVPIGKPNDNVQLYLLNDADQLLPVGLAGELCIGGTGVGAGYLNNRELTAEKFYNNPFGDGLIYRTGDLMRWRTDGRLDFIGRKDFQVKLRGLRIELGEIEYALRQQDGISDSLVLVHDDKLVAYLVGNESDVDRDSWRTELAEYLPPYMVPSYFILLPQWPLTPNGKVDRKALPSPDDDSHRQVEYVAPRDDVEEKLAQIWCDVLGLDRVGVNDDFFDLGGHSLMASRAVTQFQDAFGIEIPLKVLFEMTTIAQIAAYVKATQWATTSAQQTSDSAEEVLDEGDLGGRDEGFL